MVCHDTSMIFLYYSYLVLLLWSQLKQIFNLLLCLWVLSSHQRSLAVPHKSTAKQPLPPHLSPRHFAASFQYLVAPISSDSTQVWGCTCTSASRTEQDRSQPCFLLATPLLSISSLNQGDLLESCWAQHQQESSSRDTHEDAAAGVPHSSLHMDACCLIDVPGHQNMSFLGFGRWSKENLAALWSDS